MKSNIASLAAFLCLACEHATPPPELGIDRFHPAFQMVTYNLLRIYDNDAVSRPTDDIERVGLGLITGGYVQQVTLYPTIDNQNSSYFVRFDTLITVSDTTFTENVRVRLYLKSGQIIDQDTTITTFQGPYESAEVVLLTTEPYFHVQDIAFVNDTMYILPLGSNYLYRVPLGQQSIQFYRMIDESDFLAGDSCYIFIDDYISLVRFNTNTASFDRNLRSIWPTLLNGVAAENGRVYALYPGRDLIVMDREGVVLDSMAVPFQAFHIAVIGGVIYANEYASPKIARFDTKTHSVLEPLKTPSGTIEGMEIYKGYFYYGDYKRRIVVRIPLGDLNKKDISSPANAKLEENRPGLRKIGISRGSRP